MRDTRDTGIWLKYEQGERVGEGTYGWVYHSRSKATGKRVALKQFKAGRDGDGLSHTAIREIMLLRELQHENIVPLDSVHIHRAEPCLWLAFDYADHDLYEMIRFHRDQAHNPRVNPFGIMPHHVFKSVMWQLLNGLSYLHQNWVIHRDLKPSNVLVMSGDEGPQQDRGKVRIADFGLARVFQAPLRPLSDNGVVVTIWYRAPELLLGSRHYTRAVDVWAAGCIFAELCALKPLFQGTERKPVGGVFPFQLDQLERIFKVLGHPSTHIWPDLQYLPHWHDNTDNIRTTKPEYPRPPQPAGGAADHGAWTAWAAQQLESAVVEGMRSALPSWLHGQIPAECRPSPEAFQLLARMLDPNPNTRISAEDALRHEYFTQCAPAPTPNVFYAPGAKEPSVRYSPRIMGTTGTGGAGDAGHAAQPAAVANAVPRAPARPAGRGTSATAAAGLGNPQVARKRKAGP